MRGLGQRTDRILDGMGRCRARPAKGQARQQRAIHHAFAGREISTILDGALQVHRLALHDLGRPGMGAVFEAEIEPIDLAQLCRVFGWPEFGGQLSGRLPGLRLEDDLLSLDGALTARAFDGDIEIDARRG